MKVIVVEDNPVYNDYVCNFLKKGGFVRYAGDWSL